MATATVGLCATLGYFATPAFAYKGSLRGTPCSTSARVCLDLDDQKAWLAKDGKITYGPVRISSGGEGKETPKGTFTVLWKNKDHKSRESRLPNGQPAPMPNSVFFAPGGIAFHGGSARVASAGCVHVPSPDDARFFTSLTVGDEVQVVESLDRRKGGFYGVNNLKKPSDRQRDDARHDRKDRDSDRKRSSDAKKDDH